MNRGVLRVATAVVAALVCHTLFAAAVGSMAWGLANGMQQGLVALPRPFALLWDLLLVLQFPLLHSFLLTPRGRRVLERCAPAPFAATLRPTCYATTASLQLLATFWLWAPSGVVWSAPAGWTGAVHVGLFVASWVFLQKALWDAGLMLQSGAAGWWALLRGRRVDYGTMPERGLFAVCRQPIYLGFALVLLTAPTTTPDWLGLCLGWGAYCVVGPRRKEARWLRQFGEGFATYRASVPYFVPRVRAARIER